MKKSLFLTFSFLPLFLFAQIKVTGIVVDKWKDPLPGVTIIVKGTEIGTASDVNGKFEIVIPKRPEVLVFSGIGLKTKEITINDSTTIEVKLKDACHIDYFRRYDIGVSYWIGFLNSLNGGKVKITAFKPKNPISFEGGYQTSINKDFRSFIQSYILFNDCYYWIKPTVSYNVINFENEFYYESINLSSQTISSYFWEHTVITPSFGYSNLKQQNILRSQFGFGMTLTKLIWVRSLNIHISSQYWLNFWELKTGTIWNYRKFHIGFEYEKIHNFEELHLSFGRKFSF